MDESEHSQRATAGRRRYDVMNILARELYMNIEHWEAGVARPGAGGLAGLYLFPLNQR